MASPDFVTVWDALAARVAAAQGIADVADRVPDSITATPAAVVQPGDGDFVIYDQALGDIGGYEFVITLYTPGADVRAGQVALLPFLAYGGNSSIRAAVNGTLGSVVSNARVRTARNWRSVEIDSIRYICVDLPVEVLA